VLLRVLRLVRMARFDFTPSYQYSLGEELYLTSELLKFLLGRSVRDNELICPAS
jgi:hypothetical protein